MADGKGKSDDDFGGTIALVLIGAGLAFLVAIPAALGYVVFLLARQYLGRRENIALVVIGGAGLLWQARYAANTYGRWLGGIIHGDFSFSTIPWVALVTMTMIFAGTLGLIAGTAAVERFGRVLRPGTTVKGGEVRGARGKSTKTNADTTTEILPDLVARQQAHGRTKLATPPGGALTVQAGAHSVITAEQPGKRTFPIGVSLAGSPVMLSEEEIKTHGLILGATGSGKSETIKALVGCLLDLGWSGTVLDLKEDTGEGGLLEWCFDYATAHSTPFQELALSNPNSETWFNPLAGMGPDEMRDTILSLNEFEAAYYEALNKELLGQLIMLMTWAHQSDPVQFPEPTMYDLAKICGAPSLAAATRKMRAVVQAAIPGVTDADFRVLSNPSKAQQESAVGFGSRLGNLYDSQVGRTILRPGVTASGAHKRMLDVTVPGLTYVGLDSQGKPDLTRVVSSALLQRLSVYASQRTTGQAPKDRPRFVVIDEANWINREITQNLLSRARGAGISMWLCTQGPKDWIDKTGDDWGKLTNNINVAIIMRQGEPESAELCAEYLGKELKTQVSERVTQTRGGIIGPRRVRDDDGKLIEQFNIMTDFDYRVQPDELRELTIGEAMVRVGAPVQRLEYAKVLMRDPKSSPLRR